MFAAIGGFPGLHVLAGFFYNGFTGFVPALRDVLLNLRSTHHNQQRVAIYGAGEAGAQLAAALRLAGNHRIVAFSMTTPPIGGELYGVAIQPYKFTEMEGFID